MKKILGKGHHSLRVKMTVCLLVLLGISILGCWILSLTMMESYFVRSERKNLTNVYKMIDEELEKKGSVNTLYLEGIAAKNNIKIIIARSSQSLTGISLDTIYSSTGQDGKTYMRMFSQLQELQGNLLLGNQTRTGEEVSERGYSISQRTDTKLRSTSIDLVGLLGDTYYIAIGSSVEGLQTAAGIAVRFLAYAALAVTVLASFVMFWYTKRFTRPIEEMSEIAERMTNLDFNARVINLPNDEIGQLGKSMNQLSGQLEETISELKSANIELQKDIDKKIQIDEMRKEFLSHVSHELKTPIALIQGYAEGLVDEIADDPESRAFYCEVIIDEAKKMNQMVQKLMTLNQIEFGQNQLDIKRFDLTELLRNMIEANQIRFNQTQVTVEFSQVESVYAWGDEFMIEDVINNYISNAFNHVFENGKVKIWMELRNKYVRVWVYNEGELIPEEEQEKIWIKFYKVDKARTREYGGSGVGLSIVAAIMESHGCQYGVKNYPGGPAFYFDLEL